MSATQLITRMVSATVSPLEALETPASGKAQYLTAQVQHGRLKRKTGTGARLVEKRCQTLARGNIFISGRIIVDTVGKVHQAERFFQREIRRVDQMSHTQSPL